jgi:hypothetical protein
VPISVSPTAVHCGDLHDTLPRVLSVAPLERGGARSPTSCRSNPRPPAA